MPPTGMKPFFTLLTCWLWSLLPLIAAPSAQHGEASLPPAGKDPASRKFQWHPVQINGKQYIPLEEVKTFYLFDQLIREDKSIQLISKHTSVKLTLHSQEVTINGIKFFLSEPIRLDQQRPCLSRLDLATLIDPVLRPSFIKNAPVFNTVIIDPGHGGKDAGAAGLEAQYTLMLAKQLENLLQKKGYRTVLTRNKNITMPLADRVKIANNHENAIMLSLHFNAGSRQANGFETYVMSARIPKPTNQASIALATAVHSRCILHINQQASPKGEPFHIADRGIRRARFNILSSCKHPTIYLEAGYLTHPKDAKLIKQEAFRSALAKAIAQGIHTYHASIRKE